MLRAHYYRECQSNKLYGAVGNRLQKLIHTASLRDNQKAMVPFPKKLNYFMQDGEHSKLIENH